MTQCYNTFYSHAVAKYKERKEEENKNTISDMTDTCDEDENIPHKKYQCKYEQVN